MEFLGFGNEERKQARKERKDAKSDIRLQKKESRSMTPRERRMYEAENERLKIEAGLKETEALTTLAKSDSGSSNVIWYVLGGIVLVGGVYYFMRKKK